MTNPTNENTANEGHPSWGFETLAIHAGQEPNALTGDVVVPIHQTSTYAQDGVGGMRSGYEYSRSANPTRTALETCLGALESSATGAATALAFASGLAAEDTLLRALCRPGDHVIVPDDAYGGTYRLFAKVLAAWGLEHTAVAIADLDAVAAAKTDRTRLIWCETPSNPLLGIADVTALADIAHATGAHLVVDNTFASPYLQQPLSLGADVVAHSTTKYLGGHSDVVGGALVATDPTIVDQLRFHQNAMGSIPGPFDCWLVLRGAKTLGVRMERHCDNAEAVVEWLGAHRAVSAVRYPGLADHQGHDVAARQMRRFGGMVSFQLHGGEEAALQVCERTKIFTLAESLGGVESLIEHPARMTHA
ncbi:MAG: cystathionine gamma-synthase, partial [Aquihabitans sp.]